MKKQYFTTPEEFHTKIGMVFNTAIALPLLPFVWLFLEIKENDYQPIIESGLTNQIISYLTSIIGGVLVLKGLDYLNKSKSKSWGEEELKQKLIIYGEGLRSFFIFVGIAGLIMAAGLFFTASGVIIISYVIMLFAMSFYFPKPKKYVRDLKLKGEMEDIILNQKDYRF